ncbi:MAG TPA: alkaline phosphatase family protein, partial [Terriglobales bacterium]
PQWSSMAIMVTYDDSDGWYDHVMPPIVNQSNDPANDSLLGPTGLCGTAAAGAYLDRCGYGTRLPFLVISPFAKQNFVDHSLTDITSILRFIEDNWNLAARGFSQISMVKTCDLGNDLSVYLTWRWELGGKGSVSRNCGSQPATWSRLRPMFSTIGSTSFWMPTSSM